MEKVGVRAFENLKDKSYVKLGHIKQSRIVKIKKLQNSDIAKGILSIFKSFELRENAKV